MVPKRASRSNGSMRDAEKIAKAKGKKVELYKMNPFPRKMFLNRFSCPELVRLANISTAYFNWVRGYFAEYKVINLKPYVNKMCLSREPCSVANFSCRHRVVRSVSYISDFIAFDLLQIDTICIQSPKKPPSIRSAMNSVRKICGFFSKGIRKVIIDVSDERPYAELLEKLLRNNDDTLEKFMIRNSNVDESNLNFPHFLNRTIWTDQSFPMRTGFLARKMSQRDRKLKEKRAENERQLVELQEELAQAEQELNEVQQQVNAGIANIED